MVNVLSAMEIRDRLGETLDRIYYRNEKFLVERRGNPVAVIISVQDFEAIAPHLEDIEDLRDALVALKEYRAGKGRPFSDFVKELRGKGVLPG